jgi:lipopolysaccharide cholinephosphotransferase
MAEELNLREIQLGAYEVLKKIHQICIEQHLTYFLIYGTLIGAIRNKGIIPWDDDIDIMMPRPDYEKLKKYFISNEEILKPYKFFDKSTVPDYPHMIARISDMRYCVTFNNEKNYGIGLFVDIYPLDGVGTDETRAIRLLHKTKKIASLCFLTSRRSFGVDNTDSKLKMIIKCPAYIWAKFRGNTHYIKILTRFSNMFRYEDSEYVACLVWPAGKKYGRERDVFKKNIFDTIDYPFEDGIFKIPAGYDEFLSVTYGDYMTPPEEKGKKTHHTYSVRKVL